MRKWIAILTGLSFSLALMACGAKEPQVIPVVGTGSGAKILESVCSSFSDKNKDVVFTVPESIGSGGGIKALGADKNVIGRVARKLKDKEKPLGLTYTPIAKMPIVFFVHSGVHVNDLTTQQVCDVYAGKIKNWKEVGGGDMAIRVVRREKDDSSYKELQKSFPGFGTLAITLDSELTLSDPETLEYVKATAGAIAFGTYGNATGRPSQCVEHKRRRTSGGGLSLFRHPGPDLQGKQQEGRCGGVCRFCNHGTRPRIHFQSRGKAFLI